MCSSVSICVFYTTWLRFWILFGLLYCSTLAHSFLDTDSTLSQLAMASGSSGSEHPEPGPSTSSGLGGPSAALEDVFDDDGPFIDRHLYTEEVLKMWNLARVIKKTGTNEQCVAFAEENGLVLSEKLCRTHRTPMKIAKSTNRSFDSWCCTKGNCKTKSKIPRNNGTFFENIKIDLVHVFFLMYAFSRKWSYNQSQIINEDPYKENFERCLSRVTICDWYNYFRETIVIYQIDKNEAIGKIGGPGKIVQIDESKFGKRKYNRGRHIEGHWVLGMIEDGSEDLRLEVCPDNVRSAEVLVPLILKNVEVGTTIHTDYWRAYDCLPQHGYIHKKVNHSDPINPFIAEDGTHTQRIEYQWRAIKRFFKKR
ncbi:uncharacterized protein [Epargyreus clarus]|uniref:uncharacterized protein n=1 Tax=Epargyreus clarus TaxID=520877 RepID=UPI003C30AFA6